MKTCLALLLSALQSFGTTYYVSTSGSNSNNGTSPATAWQTIAKASAPGFTYANGDQVLFKCGDTWLRGAGNAGYTSALLTPASGVTYGNYFSGSCSALPTLDGNGGMNPLMSITKANITVNGLEFDNAQSGGANGSFIIASSASSTITIRNSTFKDGAWFSVLFQSSGGNSSAAMVADGNTCTASSNHVQLGGCIIYEGTGPVTMTNNTADYTNLDRVNSGANVIAFYAGGTSLATIRFNYVYRAVQGVTIKAGSTAALKHAVTGGTMSDNYLYKIQRYGTCASPHGDGEAIEMEGNPSPYPQTGVTVARNIIIGAEPTGGSSGQDPTCGGTEDAAGTYYSSDYFYGNIIVCPCGTYNAFHFGGRDSASSALNIFANNTIVQPTSASIKTKWAINNLQDAAHIRGRAAFYNNIIYGFPNAFCCNSGGGSTEDNDILYQVTTFGTGVTKGSHTTTAVDPLFANTAFVDAEAAKLQAGSPAIGGGANPSPYNLIVGPLLTAFPYNTFDQSILGRMQGAFGFLGAGPPPVYPVVISGATVSGGTLVVR